MDEESPRVEWTTGGTVEGKDNSNMSQSITPFDFEQHQVRVILIDGEPWWVVNDVCAVLDIANSRDVINRLDSDDVGTTDVTDSLGRLQSNNIVNESGLYELIFRSNKPSAKRFRKWVTHEVLPQIRRTGNYLPDLDPDLAQIAQMSFAIQQTRDEQRRLKAIQEQQRDTLVSHAARLDSIEHNTDWLTAVAFVKLYRLPYNDTQSMIKLGKRASKITREINNLEPRKTRDQRYGEVNLCPEDAWIKAAQDLGWMEE